MKALLRRRVVDPILSQLTQGVTPGKLALALALGAVVGILPILGATTAACALVAIALRLNQPAIQVANYVAYPLQLALFLPFFQAGAWLFGVAAPAFTLGELQAQLAADLGGTMARYLGANLRAVAAWAALAPLLAAALFLPLRLVLARLPVPGLRSPSP
jgi:uncharacterized protein (DUF2062 family)